jgi:hypothetical protein
MKNARRDHALRLASGGRFYLDPGQQRPRWLGVAMALALPATAVAGVLLLHARWT